MGHHNLRHQGLPGGLRAYPRSRGATALARLRWVFDEGFTPDREVVLCGDVMLPTVQARGKTVLVVLEMWRALWGSQATLPPVLYLGQVYESSQCSMAKLRVGTPVLHLDGPVLRQTIKWLRQRAERDLVNEPGVERPVRLEFDEKLLKVEVGGQTYGVPGRGNWALSCLVSLDDLLAVPAAALRGGWVKLAWETSRVCLSGHALPTQPDEVDV